MSGQIRNAGLLLPMSKNRIHRSVAGCLALFLGIAALGVEAQETQEQQLWSTVQTSADPVQLMLFLRSYPEGDYSEEARKLLTIAMENELNSSDTPSVPKPNTAVADAEQKMFKAAQADASVAGYEAYLQAYPNGVFAEIVQQELAAIQQGTSHDPEGDGIPVEEAAPVQVEAKPSIPTGPITFESPLVSVLPELSGKTIAEMIEATPLFAPIEGLPEEYWKGKNCSDCHQWNSERLCVQANVYLSLNMQRSLDKQHPFGGALKRNLKAWAAGGCQ